MISFLLHCPENGAVRIVKWNREANTAEEYSPSTPDLRYKVYVSLDGDVLTHSCDNVATITTESDSVQIDHVGTIGLRAQKQGLSNGLVYFTGTETYPNGWTPKFNIYVLEGNL